MSIRALLVVAGAAALVTLLGIAVLDAPLARAIGTGAAKSDVGLALAAVVEKVDLVTGMTWPKKEQLASALILVGGALWFWRPRVGHVFVLLGVTHAIARTFGGELKPLFGRLRPTEALARGHVDDSFWWEGGIAFPSGHVAHYAALAFTMAYLFPRARIPAFVVLGFIVVARVGVNAHFLSDAAGSVSIAALACAGTAAALGRLLPSRS
ncbi:MAG TPA: phosphatase PAP2 family protein [Kofleriaceae bacterium]|nr:phosphatase PAP2 family protein [Kofleriaceae bacterium]